MVTDMPEQQDRAIGNRLLAALSQSDYLRLRANLEPVQLPKGEILYRAGDIVRYMYFVDDGQVSLLSVTRGGNTIEIAMVGNEGAIGIPVLLRSPKVPYTAMVQIAVKSAWRVKAGALKEEFDQQNNLRALLLRYIHALVTQITQSAVCNRFHSSEQRLARWLLTSNDLVKSNVFFLTHEFISHMLGAPRTGVTMAAGFLQNEGLIRYSRGKITILNREGLERFSCECYGIIRDEIAQLADAESENFRTLHRPPDRRH